MNFSNKEPLFTTKKSLHTSLQNASIHSIKIPLTRNIKTESASQLHHRTLFTQNSAESDLTELSWLTNNVQFFHSNPNFNDEKEVIEKPRKITNKKIIAEKNDYRQLLNQIYTINDYKKTQLVVEDDLNSSLSSFSSNSQFMSLPVSPASSVSSNSLSPRSATQIENTKISANMMPYRNACGNNKPQLTLSCLIFMALQESKNKCLPVREIYEWIEQNFPFYKNISNGGWKSSIRHNLSFSKCFKKMDRTESIMYRCNLQKEPFSSLVNSNENSLSGRKRRAPNAIGTCWTVNLECKPYLIQMLKKSSFWFHNCQFYSNLNNYISENTTEYTKKSNNNSNEFDDEVENKFLRNEQATLNKSNKKIKIDLINKPEHDESPLIDDLEESEEDKQDELLKFVQKQQEELCKTNKMIVNDAQSLDVSLSSSASSLLSAFSLLSAASLPTQITSNKKTFSSNDSDNNSSTQSSLSLNSDLEMEVASTLVDMKFLGSRCQRTK